MSGEAHVRPEHLLRLVDALADGSLTAEQVGIACFLMEATSERFVWDVDTPDGARVADAVFWLGTPEVNYPLTGLVLSKIRRYLVTGENTLTTADAKVRQ